jgi:hypothetical protein
LLAAHWPAHGGICLLARALLCLDLRLGHCEARQGLWGEQLLLRQLWGVRHYSRACRMRATRLLLLLHHGQSRHWCRGRVKHVIRRLLMLRKLWHQRRACLKGLT